MAALLSASWRGHVIRLEYCCHMPCTTWPSCWLADGPFAASRLSAGRRAPTKPRLLPYISFNCLSVENEILSHSHELPHKQVLNTPVLLPPTPSSALPFYSLPHTQVLSTPVLLPPTRSTPSSYPVAKKADHKVPSFPDLSDSVSASALPRTPSNRRQYGY